MKTFLLAGILSISSYMFGERNQSPLGAQDQISILVYNFAQVSAAELSRAEMTAQHILDQAGIRTEWVDCKPSGSFVPQQDRCTEAFADLHVRVNVVRQPAASAFRSNDSVFGYAISEAEAIGPACYAFHDRISQLAENSSFSAALILGQVMAHELGHLLLGANSHSLGGIMAAELNREKIKAGSMGRLSFSSEEAKRMRAMILQTRKNMLVLPCPIEATDDLRTGTAPKLLHQPTADSSVMRADSQ